MTLNNQSQEFSSTASNASLIGGAALLGSVVGFFLQLLVAFHFGASSNTDAYFMALSTSEMLSKLLLGGSITAVFLPMFVSRLTRGNPAQAWRLALNLLHLTLTAFVVALFLMAIFADPFVSFIAPGFDAPSHALTVKLLLVLLPSFAILYLVELTTSMLQALQRFLVPALLRLISPTVSIITIIALVKTIGIFALALGVVFGSVLQLLLLFATLHRHGFKYKFILDPRDQAIKKLLYLVYPFIFSVLMTQAAGIIYRILVSGLSEGSLSSLKFAEKVTQLLTIVFLNSITMVIYPILSQKAAQRDMAGVRDTIASSIRLITFITVPIIIGVVLLRGPIVSFVYQRGSFSLQDASMTSLALLFLVIGLTTNGISSVFGHATLALQQTRAAVAVTIASQAIAISLFVLLVPSMQHAGLALGSSLVPIAIAILYFLYLTRFISRLYQVFIHPTFIKTFVLTALMAGILWAIIPLTQNLTSINQLSLILQLLIPTLIGATFFFTGAYFWRIPEMHDLLAIAQQKLSRLPYLNRFIIHNS